MNPTLPGIRPADIPYRYQPIPPEYAEAPHLTVPEPDERFLAIHHAWLDERHDGKRPWESYWRDVPHELLATVFTEEELVRLHVGSVVCSALSDHIEQYEPLLRKVEHTQWRYGCSRDYNLLVAHLDGLRRLEMPGFDLRLVHTSRWNTAAWASGTDIYLDASLGLLVYDGGRHVLTVGFAVSRHGVLVAQVQLRKKKGNRWLYKLGRHYLDMVLDMFARAFGEPPWLIDGASAAEAVRRSYGSGAVGVTPEDEARIAALYDRDLATFVRGDETVTCERRTFRRLHATVALKEVA